MTNEDTEVLVLRVPGAVVVRAGMDVRFPVAEAFEFATLIERVCGMPSRAVALGASVRILSKLDTVEISAARRTERPGHVVLRFAERAASKGVELEYAIAGAQALAQAILQLALTPCPDTGAAQA